MSEGNNQTSNKVQIKIPEVKYEVDKAFLEGLRYMDDLKKRKASSVISLNLEHICAHDLKMYDKLMEKAKNRMKLGGRDRALSIAIENMNIGDDKAKSWVEDTDLSHTIASLGYATKICRYEGFNPEHTKILLSSIIVHDCAYPETKTFADFTSRIVRKLHMENAKNEFRKWAQEINIYKNLNRNGHQEIFYSDYEIDQISKIVGQHDNPAIGLDFDYKGIDDPKLLWAHREADRLWMLDKAGFALDLARRIVENNPWYDPKRYMEHVIEKHQIESKKYKQLSGKCKFFGGKQALYRTETGMSLFIEEITERAREYNFRL
jgi:hypothetical protein